MSDFPADRRIFRYLGLYCFVSDEGRVVGLASLDDGIATGLCLALLDEPVTISDWVEVLRITSSPVEAAMALVDEVGGTRLMKFVHLPDPTILPPLMGTEPGEA